MTVSELCNAIEGRWKAGRLASNAAEQPVGRMGIDTRELSAGEVFWALRGLRRDGTAFVADAFARGAAGVVVAADVEVPEDRWAIRVDDTQDALWRAGAWFRGRFCGTPIAVTGSVGKTTTRQMIHTVLGTRLRGSASPRNYNNHIGLPLSLLGIAPEHDYAVLELGASRRGEIAALAGLCAPRVGVITQIGDAHLAGFGSRQAVAEAKAELLAALPEDGHAILVDDPWLRSVAKRCPAPVTWVGTSSHCDLHATDVATTRGRLSFRIRQGSGVLCRNGPRGASHKVTVHGAARAVFSAVCEGDSPIFAAETVDDWAKTPFVPRKLGQSPYERLPHKRLPTPSLSFEIPVWGRHHLAAALCAIAVGRLLGLDFEEMAGALRNYQPVAMRCEVSEIREATVINDTYNANPTAMRAALELVADLDAPGRRIVVLGDMDELGEESPRLHWELGKQTVTLAHADMLIACGRFARHVVGGARAAGMARTRAIPCELLEQTLPYLGQAILPGDVVLVKGSRSVGMERIIEALNQYPSRRTA